MATLGHKRTGVWGPGNIGDYWFDGRAPKEGSGSVQKINMVVSFKGHCQSGTESMQVINLRRCTSCLWVKVFVVSETTPSWM